MPHEKEVKPAYYQSEKTNANKNPKSFDNDNNALLFLEFIDHQIKILMKITFPMAQSMKSASNEEKDRVPFLMPSSRQYRDLPNNNFAVFATCFSTKK